MQIRLMLIKQVETEDELQTALDNNDYDTLKTKLDALQGSDG